MVTSDDSAGHEPLARQRLDDALGTRGKTPGKGYASGMGASGIPLKTLTSIRVRTPPSGELPGVLPLLQRERLLASRGAVLFRTVRQRSSRARWAGARCGRP